MNDDIKTRLLELANDDALPAYATQSFHEAVSEGIKSVWIAEIERLRETLKMEQEKFQLETLRTSECSVLLRRWIAQPRPGRLRFHQATDIEDKIYEWRKLVGDSVKLLATPINLGRTQEPKP